MSIIILVQKGWVIAGCSRMVHSWFKMWMVDVLVHTWWPSFLEDLSFGSSRSQWNHQPKEC
jgi:hypothetical protein